MSQRTAPKTAQGRARKLIRQVTADQYTELLAHQGGVCAICGNPPKQGGRRLNVDHDHRTGQVRGLLCFVCNHHILGKYATVEKLRAAADYLEHHQESAK